MSLFRVTTLFIYLFLLLFRWRSHLSWAYLSYAYYMGRYHRHICAFSLFHFLWFFSLFFCFVPDVNAPSCIPQIIIQSRRFVPFCCPMQIPSVGPKGPTLAGRSSNVTLGQNIQCQSNTEDALSIIRQTADDARVFR